MLATSGLPALHDHSVPHAEIEYTDETVTHPNDNNNTNSVWFKRESDQKEQVLSLHAWHHPLLEAHTGRQLFAAHSTRPR